MSHSPTPLSMATSGSSSGSAAGARQRTPRWARPKTRPSPPPKSPTWLAHGRPVPRLMATTARVPRSTANSSIHSSVRRARSGVARAGSGLGAATLGLVTGTTFPGTAAGRAALGGLGPCGARSRSAARSDDLARDHDGSCPGDPTTVALAARARPARAWPIATNPRVDRRPSSTGNRALVALDRRRERAGRCARPGGRLRRLCVLQRSARPRLDPSARPSGAGGQRRARPGLPHRRVRHPRLRRRTGLPGQPRQRRLRHRSALGHGDARAPACRQHPVSYTHLRAHETPEHLVCRLLLEKKKNIHTKTKLIYIKKSTSITIPLKQTNI